MKDKINNMKNLKMSWDTPIEQEILSFCKEMAKSFRKAELHNKETGWFANNNFSEKCGLMAEAYETVVKHIKDEIKLRTYDHS